MPTITPASWLILDATTRLDLAALAQYRQLPGGSILLEKHGGRALLVTYPGAPAIGPEFRYDERLDLAAADALAALATALATHTG